MEFPEYRILLNPENLKMKYCFIVLVLGTCLPVGRFGIMPTLHAQVSQQHKARMQEQAAKVPLLFDYDSTYLAAREAEREEFLRKKVLIDSMDISENYREKLIRDLYKAKPTKRLTKALLKATIAKEEELTGDPEQ